MKAYPITKFEMDSALDNAVIIAVCFLASGLMIGLLIGFHFLAPTDLEQKTLFIFWMYPIVLGLYGLYSVYRSAARWKHIRDRTIFPNDALAKQDEPA